MTNYLSKLAFRITCLCGVMAAGVSAQTVSDAPPAEQDVIVLSPFVVSAQEEGYQATETLAGMRIRTELKDVGAAIDVLTERFLDDVGAYDMNQALKYVANMQYADYPNGGNDAYNNNQWFSSTYVSRGVTGNTVLTDFFPTGAVPIDRYNTENLTMLRGPNAILFGIGSPSGIVGASSKRANMSRNLMSVRFMADTEGSARTEVDISRVLLKNRLALRFAAVASDQHNDKNPSLNRRNAVFGTLTYQPFEGTTITVNAEDGIYDRYFDMNHLVADAYTPWVLAGRPTINFITGKGMINGSKTKGQFPTTVGSGLGRTSTGSYLTYIEGSGLPVMDWRNMARGATWTENVASGVPGSGRILEVDRSLLARTPFNRENTIVDLRANPWSGYNRNDYIYSKQSIFLEQKLLQDLDLELAWNEFDHTYDFKRNLGQTAPVINVDPNEVLPDGTPNPYVGMPYIETTNGGTAPRRSRERNTYTTSRATLSYKLDLDHHKVFRNVGLGNYQFAGLYQDYDYKQRLVIARLVNTTPLPGNPTSLANNVNRLNRRYYLQPGESSWQGYSGVTNFQQTTVPGATTSGPINFEYRSSDASPRNNLITTESWVGAVQGAWWQSRKGYYHLTGMYGIRRDSQRSIAQVFTPQANGEYTNPVLDLENIENYGSWGPETVFTATTKTYNATLRPVERLRLFYNYSDIFRASAANFLDVFGNPLRPSIGETKDFGVKLDLWGDRVFFTATKYETSVNDTSLDNTSNNRAPINDIYDAIGRPDLILERPFSYRNDISTGYEFALNASPTPNWHIRIAVGTQETIASGLFDDWVLYFEQNRALWQSNSATALLNPSAGYTTVADAIARADDRLRDARAENNAQARDQRDRNVKVNTTYTFSDGPLKALRIGAGFQWASRNAIGYARDSVGNIDVTRPFWGEAQFTTDASIGYSRKLFRGKVRWDVQLNLYNLMDEDPLFARMAVDDGQGNPIVVMRYTQRPFYAQLSNTFRF